MLYENTWSDYGDNHSCCFVKMIVTDIKKRVNYNAYL